MKKLLATVLVFALLLPVLAGCQSAYATQQSTTPTATTISREKALEIALADAGLTAQEVYDTDIELDRDRDILHYDVDFEKGGRDYEYEIHAETGEILRKEVPTVTPPAVVEPPVATEPPAVTQPATPAQRLSPEEAKNIALAHAGLTAAEVRGLEAELDRERGVWVYEVDFESGNYEYEYEIHAETGEILRSEKEWD